MAYSEYDAVASSTIPTPPAGTTTLFVDSANGFWSVKDSTGSVSVLGAVSTHAASHENGGGDEISVLNLSGLLADAQTPLAHETSHKSGGSDEILLDELGAPTDVTTLNVSTTAHGLTPKLSNVVTEYLDGTGAYSVPPSGAPSAHAASHQNGGGDEISVAGLSGQLADDQLPVQATEILKGGAELATQVETDAGTNDTTMITPLKLATKPLELHASAHENGGGDEISVLNLSGLLADGQTPLAHEASHKSGGSDEILLDEFGTPTDVTTLNASITAHGLLPKLSNVVTEFLDGTGAYSTPVGGSVAFADSENADTAVNTLTDVEILSKSLTGIAAGDIIQIETFFTVLNNSGATRKYTQTYNIGGIAFVIGGLFSVSTSATDRALYHTKITCTVLSSGSANVSGNIEQGRGAAGATLGSGVATSWVTTATDVTGTKTISLDVKSDGATATQTLTLNGYTIRLIKQST